MNNRTLALDVGFANTGWMVLQNHKPIAVGVIQTNTFKDKTPVAIEYSLRSQEIACSLKDIILKYDITEIVGELPHGGAQSARAASMMAMSNAVVSATGKLLDIPMEWTTPREVKLALSGNAKATKDEQMEACLDEVGGFTSYIGKSIFFTIPNCEGGENMRKKYFEHIADAYGAYKVRRCV